MKKSLREKRDQIIILDKKSHGDDVLNDTQKLAVMNIFFEKKNDGANKECEHNMTI